MDLQQEKNELRKGTFLRASIKCARENPGCDNILAPVIEDDIFIGRRDFRCQKVSNGPHDSWWREVTLGIVVAADHENAGMMAVDLHNQVVQIQEVAVIAGQQSTIFLDSMSKMDRIIISRQTDISRKLHIVSRLTK